MQIGGAPPSGRHPIAPAIPTTRPRDPGQFAELTSKIQRCMIHSMKRTQVQIPDPLYEDIRRIAERRDWSVSEVFRRAVEAYVAEVPEVGGGGAWAVPQPREMGEPKVSPGQWRELLADDEAGI